MQSRAVDSRQWAERVWHGYIRNNAFCTIAEDELALFTVRIIIESNIMRILNIIRFIKSNFDEVANVGWDLERYCTNRRRWENNWLTIHSEFFLYFRVLDLLYPAAVKENSRLITAARREPASYCPRVNIVEGEYCDVLIRTGRAR